MTTPETIAKISAPLPWQADVWSRLNQQILQEQLPHALLLTGPQYTGKNRLALALARFEAPLLDRRQGRALEFKAVDKVTGEKFRSSSVSA